MALPVETYRDIKDYDPFTEDLELGGRNCRRTILTPERHLHLLNPHDFPDWFETGEDGEDVPRSYLEQTDDGWLFRRLPKQGSMTELQDLEWCARLLDGGESHPYGWWRDTYRHTRDEGKEGWRLPSTEEFFDVCYALLQLSKDPRYRQVVDLFLGRVDIVNPENDTPGLRGNLRWWPLLADHIQYGDGLSARVTNPFGKDVSVDIPFYENNYCALAPQQPEGLLGSRVLGDKFSWLETIVGSKWPLLPQILQFVAPRINADFKYQGQGEPVASEPHLRRVGIWTPDRSGRKSWPGLVVSVDNIYDDGIYLDFDGRDVDDKPALGVRTVRES